MAPTVFTYDLTDGTALTGGPGNTGANSVTLGAGSTATASNAHPHTGATGAKFSGASGQNAQSRLPFASNVHHRFSLYFWYWGTAPTFAEQFASGRNTGKSYAFQVSTAGKLELLNTSNVVIWTATSAFPSAGLYRIEGYGTSPGASTGTLTYAYYAGDSLTAIQSNTVTGQSFNTGNYATFDIGRISTGAAAVDVYIDDVQLETSASAFSSFIGIYSSAPTSNYDVIIGVGQSNMRGAAIDYDGTDFYDIGVYQWDSGVVTAVEPLASGDGAIGMGAINRFVRSYIAAGQLTTGRSILIVQCARGGTGFSRPDSNGTQMTWQIDDAGGVNLYDAAKVTVAAAMTAAGSGSRVVAVLANHGSTDGTNAVPKATYKARVTAFIDAFRGWIGTQSYAPTSTVKYVMMQMRPDLIASGTAFSDLDAAQQELAAAKTNVRFSASPSGGTYYRADSVHFNAAGQRLIGAGLYTAWTASDPSTGGSLQSFRRRRLGTLRSRIG